MDLDKMREVILESIKKWDSKIIKFVYYFLVGMDVIEKKGE